MRKIYALLFTVVLFVSASVNAQSVGNYVPARTTGITYSSISGTGTSVASWRNGTSLDDNLSDNLAIGFTFYYSGVAYTQFRMSTNGFMTFNTTSTAIGNGLTSPYSYTNTMLSSSSAAADFSPTVLAPMWDDLTVPAAGTLAGNIKYTTTGTAGSRVLTAEWIGMEVFANAGPDLNYQVKLYEADSHIEFVYGTMSASTATYTYSTGINGATVSAVPTTSELLTQQTANTATFSNVASNALATVPAASTMITFTPANGGVSPAAPTSITFSTITVSAITVGWTDNSTTESFFTVTRATDAGFTLNVVNTSVASITTAGTGTTYSSTQSGLIAGQTYYFKVVAANEGSAPSTALTGSQATNAGTLSGTKTVGTGGDYSNLTLAFADINTNALANNITLQLIAGYPAVAETYPIVSSNAIVGSFTVKIYPTVSGLSITSANITGTLNFNGAKNITIDGRVNETGAANLIIANTATAGYAVQFINDANNNTIKIILAKRLISQR